MAGKSSLVARSGPLRSSLISLELTPEALFAAFYARVKSSKGVKSPEKFARPNTLINILHHYLFL